MRRRVKIFKSSKWKIPMAICLGPAVFNLRYVGLDWGDTPAGCSELRTIFRLRRRAAERDWQRVVARCNPKHPSDTEA